MGTIFIKTIIVYLFVLLAVRLMGKREIGQLQPFELVVIIIIADVASVPMEDIGTPILQGIVPIFALLVGQLIISYLNIKFIFFHKLISGKASVLISKGKIIEKNLKRQRYTIDGLLEQIRVAGYSDIKDVDYAILETSGEISVIPKIEKNPVTLEDMKLNKEYVGYPRIIIMEGTLYNSNLNSLGYDEVWIHEKLKEMKLKIKDVFIFVVDESGKIYCQEKEKEA